MTPRLGFASLFAFATVMAAPLAAVERRAWTCMLTGNTGEKGCRRTVGVQMQHSAALLPLPCAPVPLTIDTVAMCHAENMTNLALVQIASIRRFSKYGTHVTMVTPEVTQVARSQLIAAGSHIIEVGMITPPWRISASWWTTVFTKLQIFSLYNSTTAGILDKVAFVDLDAFIISKKADTIFDACGAREVRTRACSHTVNPPSRSLASSGCTT